jgi:hypothetical protein
MFAIRLAILTTFLLCARPLFAQVPHESTASDRLLASPTADQATIAPANLTPAASAVSATTTPAASPIASVKAPNPQAQGQSTVEPETVRGKMILEFGLLAPLYHRIQFGRNGTEFDYVNNGAQDVLFPTMRFSVEATLKRKHSLIFLYQPIDIRTEETLRQDLQVDNVRFPAGTAINFRYGFDFYRVSYLYNLLNFRENDEFSFGASLQLRNAIIDFTSADGSLRRSNRNVGPVPALKSRGRWYVGERAWLGFEVDGMYAPVKYFNGGKSDVVGAIVDLSLRGGYNIAPPLDLYFNLRYLGGGATGTSNSKAASGPGDGYSSNWLHFLISTVGVEVKLEKLFTRQQ